MPQLAGDLRDFVAAADKLGDIVANLSPLNARYQNMVAEVVMLRLFALIENTVASAVTKLCCNTMYLDGTPSTATLKARGAVTATDNMLRHGRANPLPYLKWTMVRDVKKNVRYVMPATEHCLAALDNHVALFDEMRLVRNRIAHSGVRVRQEYRPIVQRYYGAYLPWISPGTPSLDGQNGAQGHGSIRYWLEDNDSRST